MTRQLYVNVSRCLRSNDPTTPFEPRIYGIFSVDAEMLTLDVVATGSVGDMPKLAGVPVTPDN